MPPGNGRTDAHDGLDQLALTVAFDPGDPQDLAAVDREGDVGQQVPATLVDERDRSSTSWSSSVTVLSPVSGDGSSDPTISSAS